MKERDPKQLWKNLIWGARCETRLASEFWENLGAAAKPQTTMKISHMVGGCGIRALTIVSGPAKWLNLLLYHNLDGFVNKQNCIKNEVDFLHLTNFTLILLLQHKVLCQQTIQGLVPPLFLWYS